jgi:acetyl-CoA hydrolase
MNTPLEVDVYAHANSTCVHGSRMVHGLGGSGDFLRHARISILHTPSVRASHIDLEGISCIVPMVPHVDHTEHDIDVVCTEQGLADVRGMAPRERARHIIMQCAHPTYRGMLMDYLECAEQDSHYSMAMHEPHNLQCAFQMHTHLQRHGHMRITQWNSHVDSSRSSG